MTTNVMPAFDKTQEFQNAIGGTLELAEIIKSKQIVLIKFSYLTEPQMVKAEGIKGFFGAKTIKQEENDLIIIDTKGISLNLNEETGSVIARFSEKSEFEKLSKLDYDDTTLRTNHVMNVIRPYSVVFHIQNLKNVYWEDK